VDLPTYTNIWRIEKRLYKLYDFRLPMPLPVGQIAVFLVIAVPYVLVLSLLGLPFSHTLLWVYVLPPGVLAWLTTRPVLEGKRLPELVLSQVRYLLEPKTWCRMAPLAEKDEIVFVCRVWRQAEPVLADEPEAEPEVAVTPAAARRAASRPLALTRRSVPRQLAPSQPARRQLAPGQLAQVQQVQGQQAQGQQVQGQEAQVRQVQGQQVQGQQAQAARPGEYVQGQLVGRPVMAGNDARVHDTRAAAARARAAQVRAAQGEARPSALARPAFARPALAQPEVVRPESVSAESVSAASGSAESGPAAPGSAAAARIPAARPPLAIPDLPVVGDVTARPGALAGDRSAPPAATRQSGVGPVAPRTPAPRPAAEDTRRAQPAAGAAAAWDAARREPSGRETPGRETPGRETPGREIPGREIPGTGGLLRPPAAHTSESGARPAAAAPPASNAPAPGPRPVGTPPVSSPSAGPPRSASPPSATAPRASTPTPPAAAPRAGTPPAGGGLPGGGEPAVDSGPAPGGDRPADVPPPRPARPVVTVTGDTAAERPLPGVEGALRSQPGQRREGWRDRVVVVPGGHRPGKPDQLQRDRARARLPVDGSRRIVVLGCTRGAGQTMTVLLAGDMLAGLRGEPVAVLDLNPGRGSLTERAAAIPGLVQDSPGTAGRSPAGPARAAESGLQVISGSVAAGGDDAGRILDLVAARYSLTLADPAAGYVPRTLEVADQLLLVAPASAEAASALAMTFEWLEAHGHGRLAASAITVLNGVSGPTRSHVEHAATVASGRCRAIVKVPWDSHLKDLMQERAPAPARHQPAEPAAGAPAILAAPTEPAPAAGHPATGHGGSGVLSPALTQAYTALAGVLIAGLADPGDLRSARA
jgi:MinD-like ATPase involved in chromosome partitioning or flagellar assembly